MSDPNGWMMSLSFLLGLSLTLALTIRRVTREVPVTGAATTAVGNGGAYNVLEEEPYGTGSIRVNARTAGPAGYTVKGDRDTMRFFTADSADYDAIEAEVWFADEHSAEKSGFQRWNR
jgi:uncharacterized membrane protein ArfC